MTLFGKRMNYRPIALAAGIAVALVSAVYFGGPVVFNLWWHRGIPELATKSEVPIVRDLVFAPGQPNFEILEMQVSARQAVPLKEGYGFRFILQAKLRYRVIGRAGFRPEIKCAHITARCVKRGNFGTTSESDIEIVPIFEVFNRKTDKDYDGTPLDLSTTLEDIVGSNSWGENVYRVHCGSQTGTVRVFYDKGSGPDILDEQHSNQ
jgi:hypothetical protein